MSIEKMIDISLDYFKSIVPNDPKDFRVFTIVNSVSRSGMTRKINAYIMHNNEPICIARNHKLSGCGMDMCWDYAYRLFHLVYNDGKYNSKVQYQNYRFHEHM